VLYNIDLTFDPVELLKDILPLLKIVNLHVKEKCLNDEFVKSLFMLLKPFNAIENIYMTCVPLSLRELPAETLGKLVACHSAPSFDGSEYSLPIFDALMMGMNVDRLYLSAIPESYEKVLALNRGVSLKTSSIHVTFEHPLDDPIFKTTDFAKDFVPSTIATIDRELLTEISICSRYSSSEEQNLFRAQSLADITLPFSSQVFDIETCGKKLFSLLGYTLRQDIPSTSATWKLTSLTIVYESDQWLSKASVFPALAAKVPTLESLHLFTGGAPFEITTPIIVRV
jgi:hypothetical protein